MKNLIIATLLLTFSLTSCTGQKQTDKTETQLDSIEPIVNSSVHKEYDEDGNLISVDSTYSYFYSNIKDDSILEQNFFNKFKIGFDDNFNHLDSIMANDFFNEDMFKMHDFYNQDFFSKRFRINDNNVDEIFKKMDSIKNRFYLKKEDDLKKEI
ncbi:hypothetical protein JBL43_15135 [Aureibaculum sp. A20]|uniref:DUF4296 domain-containing protein n=1 Tax=Aureibaculum flavum TaxID=2795986 RepID=A0ABS0WUF0_9FLAO|nr:hypothetical protein [Aureibaculum flavum]MBJ2175585.1 hypothetical protein [Aureibaculum flavum]